MVDVCSDKLHTEIRMCRVQSAVACSTETQVHSVFTIVKACNICLVGSLLISLTSIQPQPFYHHHFEHMITRDSQFYTLLRTR